MLATVPHLLASCVPQTKRQPTAIKALRLVNKEVSALAMTAVTVCSVQLGGSACLEPEDIVRLMSTLKLKHLLVTVMMTPGELGQGT